jgi:hypothetical protein
VSRATSRCCDVFDEDRLTGGWYDDAEERVFLEVQDGDDRPEALIREAYILAILGLTAHMGFLHEPELSARVRCSSGLWQTGSGDLGLDQMASMRNHDLVAVTISVQGGTHLRPNRLTDVLLDGSDLTGIRCPRHRLHDGRRGRRHAPHNFKDAHLDGAKPGGVHERPEGRGFS